jgi:hypothetical protein
LNGLSRYADVTKFVQAVVAAVIPPAMWGSPGNKRVVMAAINSYVRLRRFERLGDEQLSTGFKIIDCDWLFASKKQQSHRARQPSEPSKKRKRGKRGGRMSKRGSGGTGGGDGGRNGGSGGGSDERGSGSSSCRAKKRHVSAAEHQLRTRQARCFLHWVFDVLVSQTIRAHFYVTETSSHRNRVFYFRQPLWVGDTWFASTIES